MLLLLALLQETPLPVGELKTTVIEKPASVRQPTGYLGISPDRDYRDFGVRIAGMDDDTPARVAGLEIGDVLVGFGEKPIGSYDELRAALRKTQPGDKRWVFIQRDGEELEFEVTMGEASLGMSMWKKEKFHLAVVLIEFEDVRRNPAFTRRAFEQMLFSQGSYTGANVSREQVFGSLADYYAENSYGKLTVTGQVFDWVQLEHPRSHFEQKDMGSKAFRKDFRDAALELVKVREGEDCFDAFDGVILIYAGEQSHYRPKALWPHRASLRIGKKSFPYYLSSEGGDRMAAIGVHVHEFGHMLGLPDQYGARHATGIGKWCVMAVGHMGGGESRNHRPYHLCAWCKARLGWVTPAIVDPDATQSVRLEAVERDGAQVVQILTRPDASEYFLLENRQRIGFDSELDADGLLIWRVSRGGVDLVEAHGSAEKNASLLETEEIPFPSVYNDAFTPRTTPSSKSRRPGAKEVYVTAIREVGGDVTLRIGAREEGETWEPPRGEFH